MISYDIKLENQSVGIVCVEHVGLYTQFQCRCTFKKEGSYRIMAQYGASCINLGLCVPENNVFVTRMKVATKKLNGEIPHFFAVDTKNKDLKFFPVKPEHNISCIANLPEAKFYIENGVPGILIEGGAYELSGMTSSE